ncbi:kinase-like domain-containing protein [Phaeosphaeriaceae sp. PMI808]|nr:kinase-like domain-containing protein [Phaeosphaeriaceae sp. PMI808]
MQTNSPLEASKRPELFSDEADSDEEDDQSFSEVLTSIRQENIVSFCIETRGRIEPSFGNQSNPSQRQNATLEPLIFGSYHAIFPIKFQDEVRWILKVPAVGTRDHFDSSSAAALRSEALTMRLIRKNTSIPVPEIFAFDSSLDNELGVPFILMSFADGASAYEVWFDKTIAPEELQARRTQMLEDLAAAMIQLDRFAFKTGGAPVFDKDGAITEIGPMRCVDHQRMLERLKTNDGDETPLYYTAGPFLSPQAFYRHAIDREEPPTKPLHQGIRKLLQLFLDWIPDLQAETPFVLTHPDFNFQNILVSPQGRLQSLIDWDGVTAVPHSIGNETLPSFLTRDWDPAMYAWNENMERGIQPIGLWEDSTETLQQYRRNYQELFKAHFSSTSGNNCSMTKLSLYVQNLVIAAEDTVCRFEIVKKFVEEILPLTLNLAEIGEREKLVKNLNVFDISSGLVDGTLEQRFIDLLRRGFEALLS